MRRVSRANDARKIPTKRDEVMLSSSDAIRKVSRGKAAGREEFCALERGTKGREGRRVACLLAEKLELFFGALELVETGLDQVTGVLSEPLATPRADSHIC